MVIALIVNDSQISEIKEIFKKSGFIFYKGEKNNPKIKLIVPEVHSVVYFAKTKEEFDVL